MSLKKHIVSTMKRLYNNKFISKRDGNVSFKPKHENYFYISAGSIKKDEINEDQIIKVNFEKKKNHPNNLDNYKLHYLSSNKYKPSREINMHSFLLTHPKFYNDDLYVVHAHPPNIVAYMGINESRQLNNIKNYFPELNVGSIGRNVPYIDAGTYNLAAQSFINLKNNDIIGLERHGSLSIGNDIDKIFEDIETIEYYIDILIKNKNLNK